MLLKTVLELPNVQVGTDQLSNIDAAFLRNEDALVIKHKKNTRTVEKLCRPVQGV